MTNSENVGTPTEKVESPPAARSNVKSAKINWINGNARFEHLSGLFLAAHIGQIGLMAFWAGAFTLFELSKYSPDIPMYEQGLICLPQLARLGWGISSGGTIGDTYPYFVIGVMHLAGAAVYAAGSLYHTLIGPDSLKDNKVGRTARFDFAWDDSKKAGFVLGHHLLFIGAACLLFVYWAGNYGLYDPAIGEVRTVSASFDPAKMVKYGWAVRGYNPFLVDNLEDVMSGHLFVGILEIAGGVFHIIIPPMKMFTRFFKYQTGDGQLSFALAGIALMGFNAAYFTAVNEVVFPVELFGPVLDAKFGVAPYFADSVDFGLGLHSSRFWISNFHFFFAFMALQGHFWHALRAVGFDFNRVPKALEAITEEA